MAQEQPTGQRTALSPLATALVRRRQRPRRSAVVSALLLHVLLVVAFWAGGRRLSAEIPEFRVYRVNLVSPPPQVQGEPQPVVESPQIITPPPAEAVAPTPAPVTPPAQQPVRTPPPQQPPPRPAQQTPPPAQTPPRTPPAQTPPAQTPPVRTPPAQTPPPAATPPVRQPTPTTGNNPQPVQVGGDGVNVRQDGQDFPFPAYLNNVVQQIHNHFRWSGAPNLETQVTFYILRDGSVGGIQVTRRSGNLSFDLEATGAIEQVAARGRFGALPDGWQQDRLWVSFRFLPPR
jgi:outer membrane biosynthesis protein TonB